MTRFNYQRMIHDALRRVVHDALRETADHGLEGDHHFYIMLHSTHPGVEISPALRSRFPETITIILENQFWDLEVDDEGFSVTLNFDRVPEQLRVPFAAIETFTDPSANFGLRFEPVEATASPKSETPESDAETNPALQTATFPTHSSGDEESSKAAESGRPSGEVVQIDEFRRK